MYTQANMASSRPEGDAKYLKLKVLDFLDHRLSGGYITWRQLAGELNYTSIDVDKFDADGRKIDQSSTKLLLRDWENRHGGWDVNHLKKCLANIGRNDILRDLQENFEEKGMELVEPRGSGPMEVDTDMDVDIHVPLQNNLYGPPIPQEGQQIVIVGKVCGGKLCEMKLISPHLESKLPPESHKVPGPLSANGSRRDPPMDHGYSPLSEREPRCSDAQFSKRKRNSDPLRTEVSGQSWSSGSMDNIPQREDSPKNLKKAHSDMLREKPITEPATCIHMTASQEPGKVKQEEDSYQTLGNYYSLHSTSVQEAPGNERASPGDQYLLLSSENHQDRQWCKKLCNILKKKGHQVNMLHEVPQKKLLSVFYEVDYVVVIYTENYKKEFQRTGTRNNQLFQHIQSEYKRKCQVNDRFIPVYDVAVIRQLPDALLHCNGSERDYILGLLCGNNRNKHPCYERHSSAPSQNGVGGAGRVIATPTGRNNHARSQSEPVIVREFHTPLNHSKPNSTDKKESKSIFSRFKNKKEK